MTDKDTLIRFGVSMKQDLVEQFDKMITEQGYCNRSEAIRDLVRKVLIEPKRLPATEVVAGTIVIVYDHHFASLPTYLMELQHNFHHEIVSTMHVHLNHQQCLEIIVVRGILKKLTELCQQIQVQKGVFYAELSVTHVDESEKIHSHECK
ncbi:MAG: synthetase [Firmicutes bacterium]|nr:synthetase [Bacillota bacterium]